MRSQRVSEYDAVSLRAIPDRSVLDVANLLDQLQWRVYARARLPIMLGHSVILQRVFQRILGMTVVREESAQREDKGRLMCIA